MAERIVLCVDMDYFYAQCEENRNPSWKGKPVVVCVYSGRTEESGAVATANYVARGFGVKSGMPIYQAKRILKDHSDAVFPKVDHPYYTEVSDRIMELLQRSSDLLEQVSIDEAYLETTRRTQGSYEKSAQLAVEIKKEILAQESLTCSIGIGPNKLVAKMAVDSKKPNGLTTIKPEEAVTFLTPLPVGKLYGVGAKTEQRLHELGIRAIGDLAQYDMIRLSEIFGRNLANYLHDAALGRDEAPVSSDYERKQIGRIVTLKENTRDVEVILPVLDELAEDIHRTARNEGLRFRSVGVTAIMEDLSTHSKSKTLPLATENREEIRSASQELLPQLLSDVPEQMIRRIGLRLSHLSKTAGQTPLTSFLGFDTEGQKLGVNIHEPEDS